MQRRRLGAELEHLTEDGDVPVTRELGGAEQSLLEGARVGVVGVVDHGPAAFAPLHHAPAGDRPWRSQQFNLALWILPLLFLTGLGGLAALNLVEAMIGQFRALLCCCC